MESSTSHSFGRSERPVGRLAEFHHLLDVPSLLAVTAGRPGAKQVQELTADELPHTRSELEAAFVDLCARYSLPRARS
jgi:hypothetical protein